MGLAPDGKVPVAAGRPTKPGGRTFGVKPRIDAVDVSVAIRGASAGFSVLLVGGLVQPLVEGRIPGVGQAWLPLVALFAFVIAARHVGEARIPSAHGAMAAVNAYLLMLPLVLLNPAGTNVAQISLTIGAAMLTGGAVGFVRGRSREASLRRGS